MKSNVEEWRAVLVMLVKRQCIAYLMVNYYKLGTLLVYYVSITLIMTKKTCNIYIYTSIHTQYTNIRYCSNDDSNIYHSFKSVLHSVIPIILYLPILI